VPDESTRTRLEIYGSKGSIFTEGTIGQSTGGKMEGIFGLGEGGYDAEQNKDVVREFADVEFDKLDPYSEECAYFADCILNNRKPELNSGEHAIHILDMAIKAYESSKDNKVITF
jgi:predicted dehydrogenase